jgi:nucleoid-associated protein YgaU
MSGTVGIKIANGDFYPIVEENSTLKKRLVLTTVHNDQKTVQIDLFRSLSKSMLDAQYIGSLVVDSLKPMTKGEPSIEMIISSDEDGNIVAEAHNMDANGKGEQRTLNVSLKTLDYASGDSDLFGLDFDENEPFDPEGAYGSNIYEFPSSKPEPDAEDSLEDDLLEEEKKRKSPVLIMSIATILVILAIFLAWVFLLGGKEALRLEERFPFLRQFLTAQQTQNPPQEPAEPPVTTPAVTPPPKVTTPEVTTPPETPPAPPPVIQAPSEPPKPPAQEVKRQRPPSPVLSYKVPAVIPKDGAVYKIQWGDTLWDISQAFYRNPWHYPRIARFNGIKNPDHILAGFNIRIPPLN